MFRCRRDIWFKWKTLAKANGCSVEKATEILIAEKLREFGIETNNLPGDHQEPTRPMGNSQPSFKGTARVAEEGAV